MKKALFFAIVLALFLTACNRAEQRDNQQPGTTPSADAETTLSDETDSMNTTEPDNKTLFEVPTGFEDEINRFIQFNHSIETLTGNDILTPKMNSLYAIYQTYLLETELGKVFEADDDRGGLLIPVYDVQYAMAWLYYNYDWESSAKHDELYVIENNPDYLWLPDGFSSNYTLFSILLDTVTIENDMYKFDVAFYEDTPGTPELFVFTYYFKPDLYKDLIPCYSFVKAERAN